MKNSLSALVLALALGSASADVPEGMTYQGVLTDNAGSLVADAAPENREIEFRIYSQASGGTALWGEKQTVTVFKGNFSIVLGNGVAVAGGTPSGKPALADVFALGTGDSFFFGITPVGGVEFVPRQGILTNAFSFRSKVAESVNGDFLKTESTGLGIGILTSPQATLHTGGKIFVEQQTVGLPSTGLTGGAGEKLVLWPGTSTTRPFSFGINNDTLWAGVPGSARHEWYIGATKEMTLNNLGLGVGNITPRAEFHVKGRGWFQEGSISGLAAAAGRGVMVNAFPPSSTYPIGAGNIFAYNYGTNSTLPLLLQRPGGNVGIGINNPLEKLHIFGASDPTLKLQSNGTNEVSGKVAMRQSNETGFDLFYDGTSGNEAFVIESFNGSSSNGRRMTIKQTNGNVGIATSNPANKLDVAGKIRVHNGLTSAPANGVSGGNGQRLILWPGSASNPPYGFGINGSTMWASLPTGARHVWYEGTTERMRINPGGNVGIGTTSPTRGKVQIAGSVSYAAPGVFFFVNSAAAGLPTDEFLPVAGARNISLYASNSVMAPEFNVISDARIKKIKGVSDGVADLEALTKIEITDYQMKDHVMYGADMKKKVIAQQVEKVYPQAVGKSTNVVPDLFQLAPVEEGWIKLESDLKEGEKVQLIYGDNESGIYEVTVVEKDRFQTSFELPEKQKNIFVFGREVDDFRSVDYEAISMLNVSATQEIYRQLVALQTQVADLKAKDEAREKRLSKVESLLKALAASKSEGK